MKKIIDLAPKKKHRTAFSISLFLKNNFRSTWWFAVLISLLPLASLSYSFAIDQLGINPLETLTHSTGKWSLIFLILTLLITPLRRIVAWLSRKVHASYGKRMADWNWIIRLRRMLGLYCFFYAVLHLLIYLHYDLGWEWQYLWEDIEEKNYLLIGLITFTLLTLLAITSLNKIIRWMGKYWRRLHQLIYLISILVLVHFWMLVKVGVYSPLPYSIMIALLLIYRVIAHFGLLFNKPKDQGEILIER
ncbi:sulfite oxidase heme-binding subunit YedZ [sulfur-oxidizing endosymbiont of Gigantopelta aegis]|uniref:sulfite oxidase heme-binding subunit YedZ n=1 Tax=sulfur-oxidizing endosymbiont of Gigantopelta aegis TaxID=2794934 RepID=UPI0018DC6296|nr:ferric reductase-like transmembrane domain-containing protein [sulfur-oxidizing endosymbiont of Gigantopelta aegis]